MKRGLKPFFSIIIPCLNEGKTLPDLLEDLKKQTFTDFEVTVVDAESEDTTVDSAKKFEKSLDLKIISSNKRNVSYQRNCGAKDAKAEWLIFLDADNRLPNYFLQGIKFYCEMLNVDLISTYIKPDTTNKKDEAIARLTNIIFEIRKNYKHPAILESMIIVKKKSFNAVRGFNENIHWSEGTELLSKLKTKNFKFEFIKEPKYTYSFRRLRTQSTFKVFQNIAEHEIARFAKLELSTAHQRKMYPMEGGKFYEIDRKSQSRIEEVFEKIFEHPITKTITKKDGGGIISRLKCYLVKHRQRNKS